MKRYAEVLRVPHVATLIAATLIARFPIGINALALILYLRDETGSFAIAGIVAGGLAAGAGIGAPIQGRPSTASAAARARAARGRARCSARGDRRTARSSRTRGRAHRLLVPRRLRDPADLVGAALDVADAAARRPSLLQPAYALDSVLIELIFILGPLLTAVLAAAISPASALIVSAASVVVGTMWFTAAAAEPRDRARPRAAGDRLDARSPRPACAR